MRSTAVRRPLVLLLVTALTAGTLVGLSADPAEAAVIRPFTPRFSANVNGDLLRVGNTLMTCPGNGSDCAAARNGTATGSAANNNAYTMGYVDADGSLANTFNSSFATLTIPSGSTVAWAGLYWGGDTVAGTGGSAARNAGARNQVRFAGPGASAYSTLTAIQLDTEPAATTNARYQGFVDVTDRVRAGGSGLYAVGDVQSATGQDKYAGWALVVAIRNPTLPVRNLTVFDGYAQVTANDPATIPVSGFQTPASGPVNTRIGAVAYEGDLGITGDRFRLNNTYVSDALNPQANAFNSGITELGTRFTAKTPDYANQLGFDLKRYDVSGVLPNGATSATLTLDSTQDQYYPGVVTFSTELPSAQVNLAKTANDVNGGQLLPGDTVEYTVAATSGSGDPAANVVVTDAIPGGTTYVPGSLRVLSGANTGAKTDTTADDQAEFLGGTSPSVRFRVGTGATASAGGTLSAGTTSSVRFAVTVNSGVTNGQAVTNSAAASYTPSGGGVTITSESDPVDTPVTVTSDRSVTTTAAPAVAQAGGALTYTLTARNAGPSTDPAVVVTDTLPAGFSAGTVTSSQGSCTVEGQSVRCALGSLAAGASATVTIPGTAAAPTGTGARTITNTATVSGANTDASTANDTAAVTSPVNRPPTAAADTAAVPAGGTSVAVNVLANDGDPDGDPLGVGVSGPPANGAATVAANGVVTYTPNAAFRGTDTFTYTVSDGRGGTASATVSVTVPNKPPVAATDSSSVNANATVTIPVLANDTDPNGDPLTVQSFTQPVRGTVTQQGNQLVYAAGPVGAQTVTFSYVVSDGAGGTAQATVTVQVAGVTPAAAADSATTASGTPVTVPVLANDTNAGGGTLTVSAVTQPVGGAGAVSTNGTTVTYTPAAGFRGTATFTYTATSPGGSSTADVTVTVANAAPVAADDALSVAAGTPGTIDVRANDSDSNGDPLTVTGFTQPAGGTVSRNAAATWSTPRVPASRAPTRSATPSPTGSAAPPPPPSPSPSPTPRRSPSRTGPRPHPGRRWRSPCWTTTPTPTPGTA